MIKVFISLPMRGLTDEEIARMMDEIKRFYIRSQGDDVEFLDSNFKDAPGNGTPLAFLGESISLLSEANIAIFGIGWNEARGCEIEHQCCKAYGIPTIYFGD